jgi:anti-sigma factor RsiW
MTTNGLESAAIPCNVFVELVTAYLDGALSAADVTTIDAHLDVCPGCVSVLEQFRETIRITGRLREDEVEAIDPHVREPLEAAFAAWARDRRE